MSGQLMNIVHSAGQAAEVKVSELMLLSGRNSVRFVC